MEISLVIATFNRARSIDRLLRGLPAQTLDRELWEVIVVVDGSSDDTASILEQHRGLRAFNLSILVQENSGPAGARHRGILLARGSRIVVTDDDMELSPDFLAAHRRSATTAPDPCVVLGNMRASNDWHGKPLCDLIGEFRLARRNERFTSGAVRPQAKDMATGNVSFPAALYHSVGGFDLSLRLSEDYELGYRFSRAGASFVYAPNAWCTNRSDIGNFRTWRSRQFRYGEGSLGLWKKHGEAQDLHPLGYLLSGSRAKRLAVLVFCPSDLIAQIAVQALRVLGNILQQIGLTRPAIAAYQLIESIEYHSGLKSVLKSWNAVTELAKSYVVPPA